MNPEIDQLRSEIDTLKSQFRQERRRWRVQTGLAVCAVIGAILVAPGSRQAIAQGYGVTLAQLLTRVISLENKTQYVSVSDGDMYLTGTNLHVVNGLGATNGNPSDNYSIDSTQTHVNGKGNVIVGYNETRGKDMHGVPQDARTGSHNLIVGSQQNYTSFGGLVVGDYNAITGAYTSVSGGSGNLARGAYSSVSGGVVNQTYGKYSSVSGGTSNGADGNEASVSGGYGNNASGIYSSIGGGGFNTANEYGSSLSGGYQVSLSGNYTWQGGSLHSP